MTDSLIVDEDLTLHKALKALDQSGKGIVVITSKNSTLFGIITDGDIRRAILKDGLKLELVINKNPITKNINDDIGEILRHLKYSRLRHMPIVDNEGKFVKLISLSDHDFFCSNPVVIMAGGLGTRLGELTKETPKPMLKIGTKPILQSIINSFMDAGFSNFYIAVNYKAEVIKNYFQDGSHLGANIQYIEEKERLGTAGALSYLKNKFNEDFFVINGDVLASFDINNFLEFHKKNKAHATIGTKTIEMDIPFGVFSLDQEKITAITEKPKESYVINTGIYVFNPVTLSCLELETPIDMPDFIKCLLNAQRKIIHYNLDETWVDIGKKEDYLKISNYFSNKDKLLNI